MVERSRQYEYVCVYFNLRVIMITYLKKYYIEIEVFIYAQHFK